MATPLAKPFRYSVRIQYRLLQSLTLISPSLCLVPGLNLPRIGKLYGCQL
jgi:hypothetical protein